MEIKIIDVMKKREKERIDSCLRKLGIAERIFPFSPLFQITPFSFFFIVCRSFPSSSPSPSSSLHMLQQILKGNRRIPPLLPLLFPCLSTQPSSGKIGKDNIGIHVDGDTTKGVDLREGGRRGRRERRKKDYDQ